MTNNSRRFSATQQTTVKDLQRVMEKVGATSLRNERFTPQPWFDHYRYLRDRLVLNDSALAHWLSDTFGISDRETAFRRLTEIDPLAERITIDDVDYMIPHDCYFSLGLEPGDTRETPHE